MRLYEITQDNLIISRLFQVNTDYHTLWLETKNMLEYLISSGDPVPNELKDRINHLESNLKELLTIPFDLTDSDIIDIHQEITHIFDDLTTYRRILKI